MIDWKSRKERCVTEASTYAEYVALSEAVSEIKFVIELIKFFKIELYDPIKIYEDNSGAINIATYGNFTKNSKHIEIHYHFVHEGMKEKLIERCKIDTNENIADVFTKALCKDKFEKFRNLMNINIYVRKRVGSSIHLYCARGKYIVYVMSASAHM